MKIQELWRAYCIFIEKKSSYKWALKFKPFAVQRSSRTQPITLTENYLEMRQRLPVQSFVVSFMCQIRVRV